MSKEKEPTIGTAIKFLRTMANMKILSSFSLWVVHKAVLKHERHKIVQLNFIVRLLKGDQAVHCLHI